jgi:hypothetical protein
MKKFCTLIFLVFFNIFFTTHTMGIGSGTKVSKRAILNFARNKMQSKTGYTAAAPKESTSSDSSSDSAAETPAPAATGAKTTMPQTKIDQIFATISDPNYPFPAAFADDYLTPHRWTVSFGGEAYLPPEQPGENSERITQSAPCCNPCKNCYNRALYKRCRRL